VVNESDSSEELGGLELSDVVLGICFRDYYEVRRENVFEKKEEVSEKSLEKEDEGLASDVASVVEAVEDIVGFDSEGLEDVVSKVGEELGLGDKKAGAAERRREVNDFYKVQGDRDLYNEDSYDVADEGEAPSGHDPTGPDYEDLVSGIEAFVQIDLERRGSRSMLEIAGFRDDEAEKRREEKRKLRWG